MQPGRDRRRGRGTHPSAFDRPLFCNVEVLWCGHHQKQLTSRAIAPLVARPIAAVPSSANQKDEYLLLGRFRSLITILGHMRTKIDDVRRPPQHSGLALYGFLVEAGSTLIGLLAAFMMVPFAAADEVWGIFHGDPNGFFGNEY